jgi:hypothetical protein
MAGANFLTSDGWKELLEDAGLKDTTMRTYKLSPRSQWIEEMRGLSLRDSLDRVRAFGSFLSLYLKSSSFRKYAKEITPSRKTLGTFFSHVGYGLYVGRK